ncbi:MAG: class I adenylate-forming enzyme family protein [Candidatus Zhuqueibacterota bacterium]
MSALKRIATTAAAIPDAIAVTQHMGMGKRIDVTYRQLEAFSDNLAEVLRNLGLRQGQFVGIFMQRSPEHVTAMLAILKNSAAFYSLNPKLSLHQIQFSVELCQSSILLVDNPGLIRLSQLQPGQLSRTRILHYDAQPRSPVHITCLEKLRTFTAIESIAPDSDDRAGFRSTSPFLKQDVLALLFTSGSTGVPKGVMISHQDLLNRVTTECEDFQLTQGDRLLSLLPFSFDVGLNQLYASLFSGAQLVIINSWLAQDICRAIATYRITGISGVPSIWSELLAYDPNEVKSCLSQVRYFTISGGGMAENQLRRLRDLAPNVNIFKTYGQTEAFRSGILKPNDFDRKINSVGRAVAGTEIFIVDEQGNRCRPNEPGEIIHRGDGMMAGYLGDAAATQAKLRKNPMQEPPVLFDQSVIFTGDMGTIDEEGFIYVLGRRDKMLKVKGNRVYPKEILDVILNHPEVKDAAVFGVSRQESETELIAEIQWQGAMPMDRAKFSHYLSTKLPSYMLPTRIEFVDSFPRTPSGKIQFAALEEKYS